jgi:hypothetical protein
MDSNNEQHQQQQEQQQLQATAGAYGASADNFLRASHDTDNASMVAQHRRDSTPPLQTPAESLEGSNEAVNSSHHSQSAIGSPDQQPRRLSMREPRAKLAPLTSVAKIDLDGNRLTTGVLQPKDVAAFLIQRDYLLTALEFYIELCEDGVEMKELKDFFANHRNFDSAPRGRYVGSTPILSPGSYGHSTILSVFLTSARTHSDVHATTISDSVSIDERSRISASEQAEIVREKDEYIAVMEYELRQAKDAADKLRARLATLIRGLFQQNIVLMNIRCRSGAIRCV